MTQLAKELNLESREIRKICKDFKIPLPKTGYWSKLEYGKAVEIENLPAIKEFDDLEIDLKSPNLNENDHYLTKLARIAKEIKSQFPKQSKPKKSLRNADPLVTTTGNYLKSSEAQRYLHNGKVRPKSGYLFIEVSKPLINRALRFANSFIVLCRLRGHEIKIEGRSTILIVYDQEYKIKIREKCRRVIDDSGYYGSTYLVPTGKLSLKIDYYDAREWSDTKTKKLEDQLPKLVAAFELRAQKEIADRKRRELVWLENERLRKIEAIKKARIQWESEKIEILKQHSKEWHDSQHLSQFISALETNIDTTNFDQRNWLAWAKTVAENLNPLSNGIEELIGKYDFKHSEAGDEFE